MNQISLRWKMILSYLTPLLVLLVIVGVNQVKMNSVIEKTTALNATAYLTPDILKINENITRMQRASYAYILTGLSQGQDTNYSKKSYQESIQNIDDLFEKIDKGTYSPELMADLSNLKNVYASTKEINGQLIKLVDEGKAKEAAELFKSGSSLQTVRASDTLADDAAKFNLESREQYRDLININIENAKNIVTFGALGAIILLIIFGILSAVFLSRDISQTSGQISSTAAAIAATLTQHEKAISLQGSSVSETTSTVEELVSSARLSSEQADSAAAAAKATQDTTTKGLGLVSQNQIDVLFLEGKMAAIAKQILSLSEQAGQIGNIAKLVGELAGETNMLALNAAVEAARAGEHGKGFAVVASEIRKLADQSRQSSEKASQIVAEIQKSTNTMVMTAEDGTKISHQVSDGVAQTSVAFKSLSQLSEGVYQNAQQVLLNSKQQAAALVQINEAMQNINNSSREMIIGTNQAMTGVETLTKVASHLRGIV